MKITITPAIKPEFRHALQEVLARELSLVAFIDGGGTSTDGTECDIYLEPKSGFTEANVRMALSGQPDEPPRPMPKDPDG